MGRRLHSWLAGTLRNRCRHCGLTSEAVDPYRTDDGVIRQIIRWRARDGVLVARRR